MLPVAKARVPHPPSKLAFLFERSPTHHHQGIDLVAPLGTPVLAAEGGEVVYAYSKQVVGFRGYGKVVVIRGISGRFFLYAHLDRVSVMSGQAVNEGDQVGTVGKTAFYKNEPFSDIRSSGPHLHFEVSESPYPQSSEAPRLDPVAFLEERTVKVLESDQSGPRRPGGGQAGAVSVEGIASMLVLLGLWYLFRK